MTARLAVVAVLVLATLAGTAGTSHAATPQTKGCSLSLADRRPPGGTPAFFLGVARKATTCKVAVRVMKSFHACRGSEGVTCRRHVQRSWRCRGTSDGKSPMVRGGATCAAPGGRRVYTTYAQFKNPCFGAAERDPLRPCRSGATRSFPGVGYPDPDLGFACDGTVVQGACVFGKTPKQATRHVAIIGDSHVTSWRAALTPVLDLRGWAGYSHSTGGCFFNDVVANFSPPCTQFVDATKQWLASHHEVDTAFVTANADTPANPDPKTSYELKTASYMRTFRSLPASIKHVVVLRDLTKTTQPTIDCLSKLEAQQRTPLENQCPVARSEALKDDPAAEAVRRLHDPKRYATIDLTPYVCSAASCYDVVGGTTVNMDIYGHTYYTFMRSLAPYLLRELQRLESHW